jgi:hypothetical protein
LELLTGYIGDVLLKDMRLSVLKPWLSLCKVTKKSLILAEKGRKCGGEAKKNGERWGCVEEKAYLCTINLKQEGFMR